MNNGKAAIHPAGPLLSVSLTGLAELCREAGAVASTVIYSHDKVVVFYKDPQAIDLTQCDSFDELHIRHPKKACILIAVFPEEGY